MAKPYAWLNPGLVAGSAAPAAVILLRAASGSLGANAIAAALNQLGYLTLVFLTATLACTPLKVVLGWTWPIRARRTLGLITFTYASLHLLTYAVLDLGLDVAQLGAELAKRPFITVGFVAWLLMAPLAWTSTDASVKKLGFKVWKRVHRLGYLCAVLGVIHFLWKVKKDRTEPLLFAALLALFFAIRAIDEMRARTRKN